MCFYFKVADASTLFTVAAPTKSPSHRDQKTRVAAVSTLNMDAVLTGNLL